jgi:hypothetical protein
VTRLVPFKSSGVLAGALWAAQASIGSSGGTKALGTWLLWECYSPLHNAPGGTEVRALQGCWRNGYQWPVLKHGPRSQALGRVFGCKTRTRNESERR